MNRPAISDADSANADQPGRRGKRGIRGLRQGLLGLSRGFSSQQAKNRWKAGRDRTGTWVNRITPGLIDNPLETGLATLNDRLGLAPDDGPNSAKPRAATAIHVESTEEAARAIFYAPDMDGQAEAGEIVWIWIPTLGPGKPVQERAVLVVGRTRHTILGLLISPNPDHDGEEEWLDIGAGVWDASGRQCWIRLDKVLEVSELGIRRQGAVLPRRRFERVANALREFYSWC